MKLLSSVAILSILTLISGLRKPRDDRHSTELSQSENQQRHQHGSHTQVVRSHHLALPSLSTTNSVTSTNSYRPIHADHYSIGSKTPAEDRITRHRGHVESMRTIRSQMLRGKRSLTKQKMRVLDDGVQESRHVIFVRHGESVNNVFSQESNVQKARIFAQYATTIPLTRCLARENISASCSMFTGNKDACLSNVGNGNGRVTMAEIGRAMFGPDRNLDTYNLFNDQNNLGIKFARVKFSPLRRTQDTAMQIFGPIAKAKGIPFEAEPWAHEQRKSGSDIGLPRSDAIKFAGCLGEEFEMQNDVEPMNSMIRTLGIFGGENCEDWATNIQCPSGDFPYYPRQTKKIGTTKEKNMCARMYKLQESLFATTPNDGTGTIVVTHSAVIRHIFQAFAKARKPANGAAIYGELVRTVRDGQPHFEIREDSVDLLQNKLVPAQGIPGTTNWIPANAQPKPEVDLKAYCGDQVFMGLRKSPVDSLPTKFRENQRDIILRLDAEHPNIPYFDAGKLKHIFYLDTLAEDGGFHVDVATTATGNTVWTTCADWRAQAQPIAGTRFAKVYGSKNYQNVYGGGFMIIYAKLKKPKQQETWNKMMEVLCPLLAQPVQLVQNQGEDLIEEGVIDLLDNEDHDMVPDVGGLIVSGSNNEIAFVGEVDNEEGEDDDFGEEN